MDSVIQDNIFGFDRYPIEIRESKGMFYLLCKTLGVIESDKSLDKAYEKLNYQRNQIVSKLEVFGVNPEGYSVKISSGKTSMPIFPKFPKITKYLIIFLLMLLPLGLISGYVLVTNKISGIILTVENKFKNKLSLVFSDPGQVIVVLNRVALTLDKVTPERKEELQITLRKIVASLEPFTNELKPLYSNNK